MLSAASLTFAAGSPKATDVVSMAVAAAPEKHRLGVALLVAHGMRPKGCLALRHGPGAAILPSEVTRIHLEFANRWNKGQYGPRKFWQTYLPRLKYWNPAIPMIVNRTADTTGPATLTIYLRSTQGESSTSSSPVTPDTQPSSSFVGTSKAPEPTLLERTIQIDMKGLHSDAILKDFLAKTGASAVSPTPEEEADMREVEERRERSKVDREVMARYLFAQRREAAILAQAKSEAAVMKQAM
ncbi:hypothetical protein SBRCBS47491_008788 [Sporothrix bragantina]|uniref:Ribosomal protein/NADH dehydrogenase domain-containing protein n=1 Tax=Sporothrix bragantina TaxID=671064 RepID=A0ABP0CPQ2_9PEZI